MRFSVRTKLFGAFGVVIALMVVLGVVAISKLGSVKQEADYLGTKSVNSALTTATVRSATANIRRIQNRLIFAEPNQRKDYFAKMKVFQDQLDKFLADFEQYVGDAKDRELWENTKAKWAGYQAVLTAHQDKILVAVGRRPSFLDVAIRCSSSITGTRASRYRAFVVSPGVAVTRTSAADGS